MAITDRLQNWFGLSEEPESRPGPDADFWYEAPRFGSAREALAISAVSSGIRYISETLASMPLHVYRRADDGREVASDHYAYSLIHDQPNKYQTAMELVEQIVRDCIIDGAHLSQLVMNGKREVMEIVPLDWRNAVIDKQNGQRVFIYSANGEPKRAFLDDEVLFIYGPGSTPWRVQSLLDLHAETLGVSTAARKYLHTFILKGGIGPVYLKIEQSLKKDAKDAWVAWVQKHFSGARNAGKIPVLDAGGEFKPLRVDHDKMQYVDLLRFYVEEVARILRVPPHKIQDLMRSTNNNIEEQALEAVSDCLRPWAKRIESRINVSIFGPREGNRYYAEFDLDGLLRGNAVAQAQILSAEVQNGVRKPNEWRRIRNLPRSSEQGADNLWIQSGSVPLETAVAMAEQRNQQKEPAV